MMFEAYGAIDNVAGSTAETSNSSNLQYLDSGD